ncbi:MAG: acetyl-CoA carboxylase carboxyltransferase subunit alpha [Pirellulales bacterium]|nr:acetyl-CoA carboxylase carboxyltransferase subunit alpha [Pirellulales bacterium]
MADERLTFERPVRELEQQLAALEEAADDSSASHEQIRQLKKQIADTRREIYGNLDAWQTVQVARHPDRPKTSDYLQLLFDEYVELHGDRFFADDRAMLTGFAKFDEFKVLVVGQEKGKTTKGRQEANFGMPHPEGYRKALSKIQLAAKYKMPVICLIDTPGAYPGVGAEERGQALVIAENMFEMSRIPTPIVCVVIGEGGSGGALGIGVGDRVAVLEHAYYSVISPEGCAGILWKSGEFAENAAKALRFTSRDLKRLGVIDEVINEPLGGAHRDHPGTAFRLKTFLSQTLRELVAQPTDQLLAARYEKFRKIGVFLDDPSTQPAADTNSNEPTP